jgi:hypothetical protein
MKKVSSLFTMAIIAAVAFTSCEDEQTYAKQKEYENSCINSFLYGNCRINNRAINVISETDFKAKGEVTDTARNEFVLFSSTGTYMQIVEKGTGANFKKLENGECADVLCRYSEYNINGDSLQTFNDGSVQTAPICDKMTVRNTSGTFSASFEYGWMSKVYSTTSVPAAWLTPLSYIKLGRPSSADDKIAKVRIIAPHNQCQAHATTNVYACYYEITYQRGQ